MGTVTKKFDARLSNQPFLVFDYLGPESQKLQMFD